MEMCKQAKETLAQQQPPEVRILKHLLSIQSPQERVTALQDAFAPGADLHTGEQDLLSTWDIYSSGVPVCLPIGTALLLQMLLTVWAGDVLGHVAHEIASSHTDSLTQRCSMYKQI